MVKLIKPNLGDIDGTCLKLIEEHPDWVIIDKVKLEWMVDPLTGSLRELNRGKTFVVPGYLVDSKSHLARMNVLLAYMISQYRKFGWSFVIVASSPERVDLRIRRHIEEEE